MANAFSVPQSFGSYIDPINTNLVNTVLASKQTRYDHNLAKIDETLKQFTNLPLAREKDKLYLKSRLDNVLSTVNSVQKLDLSDNNLTRQIEQSIGTAIDDEVLKQVSNTQAIQKFEQTVAEKRAKNPELYDDRNYTIAKKRAGVNEYLAGTNSKGEEVNSIGKLQYDDYYDVDKNLTEPLEKWAKELGFIKTITESGNDMFIKKETKEVLSPERIEEFYHTKLQADPKLQTQMQINADYQYGGMKDEEFKSSYRDTLNKKKSEIEGDIVKLKEGYKNIPAGSAIMKQVDAMVAQYDTAIKGYDTELKNINSENFDRSSRQFQIYSNNLLNQYKTTYAKNETTHIDYDDTPMKIQEFEFKKAEATRKAQEAAAKKAGLNPDGTPVGTMYTPKTGQEIEQEKPDVYTVAAKNFSQDYRKIDAYLIANNPDYAKGDSITRKKIRDQITTNLGKESLTAKNYPRELKDLAESYLQSSQTYTNVSNEIHKTVDNDIITMFNGMKTSAGNINLSNLAKNLPETAKALGERGVRNYGDLTKEQRYKIKMEISDNLKNTVAKGKSTEYLDAYNKKLQRESGIKFRQKENSGWFENQWYGANALLGAVGQSVKAVGAGIVSMFNEESGAEMKKEVERDTDLYADQLSDAYGGNVRKLLNVFSNDEDLSGIGSDEIALKLGESLDSRWNNTAKVIEGRINARLKDVNRPMSAMKGISYNPNVEAEKPIAQALESIVLSNNVTPTKDTAYKLEFNPDGKTAKIIVNNVNYDINDKGKQVKSVGQGTEIVVDVNQLPPAVLKAVSTEKANWTYDYRNPVKFNKTYTFNVLPTDDDKIEFIDNFVSNNPDNFTPEDVYALKTSNKSAFKTEQDYNQIVKNLQDLYLLSDADVENMKKNIIHANYEVKYDKTPGVGFHARIVNGNDAPLLVNMPGQSFDPTREMINSFKYIDGIILDKLQKYALKNAKKQ